MTLRHGEDAATPLGRWQAEFLAEVAELLAGEADSSRARSPLDFVLTDLRTLLRKDVRRVALLLLAGYLHVGNALSLRHGEPDDNHYARAAQALVELAGPALPEGALDALLPGREVQSSEPAAEMCEEPASWLRRFFSFS
ncbi:MAG: hypothetical protein L0Z62_35965 [Gemmataceae bacterium]|nr:hypothetical protein [Gemmataceae bacterium]